jgi:hypothetical protein
MIAEGSHSPAEIAAAKIRLDAMHVQSRCAAVRFLAAVDYHYDHEAEAALITALRADRSEAVRLETAWALADCRGVTVRILDALNFAALGVDADGHPAETSASVRAAARQALDRCLMRGIGTALPLARETASQAERSRAETVSTAACPVGPQAAPPRSLIQFVQRLLSKRDEKPSPSSPSAGDAYARQVTSERMRGLTPIDAESALALPAAAPHTTALP